MTLVFPAIGCPLNTLPVTRECELTFWTERQNAISLRKPGLAHRSKMINFVMHCIDSSLASVTSD